MKKRIIALLLSFALLVPTALSAVALESAPEAKSSKAAPFDYTSLYVQDGLVIAFSASGKTASDAPTSLQDSLGNSFTVGANAVWGDGALLNRGTTVDFSSAQGTKLNDKSYTYEFVLGYEDKVANTAGSTQGGCFDVGVLKYKITYTTDNVTVANAYASLKNGSASSWIYDYGATAWTAKPLLDTVEKGEIIELSQIGELSTGVTPTTIAFSAYRNGKSLGKVSTNSVYKTGFEYNPALSFKFGKNLNMEIYAVRAYSDVLTDDQRAQNHFADVCAYYSLDVTKYLTLTKAEQKGVHEAFSSVRILRESTRDIQALLDASVDMKGKMPAVPLENALSFDGYAVSLWSTPSLRAEFSLDEALITSALSTDYFIECGGVVAPADAEGELVKFDPESLCFVATDPSYRLTTAYSSDLNPNIPEKITATATFTEEEALLYRNDELVFKAYIGISDLENAHVILFDAESELFGDAVSLTTLYEHFFLNGYMQYPSVRSSIDGKLLDILTAVEAELASARDAQKTAENALADIDMLAQLESTAYASSQEKDADKYEAYADAYTAQFAYCARKAEVDLFADKLTALKEAIDTLESKIAEETKDLSDAESALYVNKFTALLRRAQNELNEAGAQLHVDSALASQYASARQACQQALSSSYKIQKTLNGTALDNYVIFGDRADASLRLLTSSLLSEYGMLLPTIPAVLARFAPADTCSIHADNERTHSVYGQSVLAYEEENGKTVTLYGNTQTSIYHAVLKLLSLFEERHKVDLDPITTIEVKDVMNQTYAVDSFFRPDGTLDTDSKEPLTIVCIGGSLTELGKKWVAQVKEYFGERFPNRPVTIYNAGVGGTGSKLGAARFEQNVLSKNPDLVIIEFSVNDASQNQTNSTCHLENMIYQCLQAEKIPGIIYAHTPQAVDKDADLYAKHCNQVAWKGALAEHYGISVVDIYDYFRRCYEEKKISTGNYDLTYTEYISDIYKTTDDGTYDVHPISTGRGYNMYAEAFIEAFDADLASMLTRLPYTDVFTTAAEESVKATHNLIPYNSDRLTYEGTWETWTEAKKYNNADSNAYIGNHRYVYPFMEDGVHRVYKPTTTSAISLTTTATDISFYYHGAKSGLGATVYVNGTQVGTLTTKTGAQQPFQTATVSLGNAEGKEVNVRIVIDTPTTTQYTFQFGYVIETFKP